MDSLENRAQSAESSGDLRSAFSLWTEAARREHDPNFFTRAGRAAQKLEKWSEAESAFAQALKIDPNLTPAMVCMGDLWAARTDKSNDESFPVARNWLLKALQRERSAPTLILLGVTYRVSGDSVSAREILAEALQLDPHNGEALYNLALTEAKRDLPRSINLMERAVEIAPDYFLAHQELGKLYQTAGDLPRGEYHLRRSLEIEPGNLWSILYLANVLAVQGKSGEAEQTYRLAANLHPTNKRAREFVARYLESIGKREEAAAIRSSAQD